MMKKFLKVTWITLGILAVIVIVCSLALHLYTAERTADDGSPLPPRGFPSLNVIKVLHVLGFIDLVDVAPEIPSSLKLFEDIEYKRIGDRSLTLDIIAPRQLDTPTPVLVFIHGGAWKLGDKKDYRAYLVAFANRGYVTASVSYRLSKEAVYPAAVLDVMCAIRWIKQNAATYLIDPDQIAVIGGSAGGHLALMVGYAADQEQFAGECPYEGFDSRVQAVIDIYGAADLTTEFAKNQRAAHQFIGGQYHEMAEKYIEASPMQYISADDPPTLVFHGTIDKTVPVVQSDRLVEKLTQLQIPHEYQRLKGWPHTMDLAKSVNHYMQYSMMSFLQQYVPLPDSSQHR